MNGMGTFNDLDRHYGTLTDERKTYSTKDFHRGILEPLGTWHQEVWPFFVTGASPYPKSRSLHSDWPKSLSWKKGDGIEHLTGSCQKYPIFFWLIQNGMVYKRFLINTRTNKHGLLYQNTKRTWLRESISISKRVHSIYYQFSQECFSA